MDNLTPNMTELSPFHKGEQHLQEITGRRRLTEKIGRNFIRPYLTEQHQDFFRELRYLFLSRRDGDGWPLPLFLQDDLPLMTVPDDQHLILHGPPGDLQEGQRLGVLGLDLTNRRRNRVNGRIIAREEDLIILRVDQAYGNCPQYIDLEDVGRLPAPGPEVTLTYLTPELEGFIRANRRFFIASGYNGHLNDVLSGMDISHRGGVPGFVQVVAPDRLIFPDYSGNNFFNTLGNILMDGKAGLMFIDFLSGARLRILGKARIIFKNFEEAGWTPDPDAPEANRLVEVEIEKVLHAPGGP
ncbi:pyridoxamine 5'-phosphate oxidase family protein [Emcibacter sp.]|uniref:pyridoxamine 5'-phosphate oxidase family protein n=1 Tax=Emcibacter sp. TaxID=1979954 RepID=UPI002AA67CC3|nr:pyridoxamine 5'-phosphate oxidase family protein [Emcibacter sp.]